MRDTELLVQSAMAARLQQAYESRLAKLAAKASVGRRNPCEEPGSPDCVGSLKPSNRPA